MNFTHAALKARAYLVIQLLDITVTERAIIANCLSLIASFPSCYLQCREIRLAEHEIFSSLVSTHCLNYLDCLFA